MNNYFATTLLALVAGAALPARAAGPPETSPPAADAPADARDVPWYRPRHVLLQTGGGLGMVAGGAGYEFANNKLELDILLGYVPKHYGGSTLSLASAKFLYSPFRVQLSDKLQLLPVTAGVYFSYTHGTINDELPGQYSSDYYWFSTDTRYGPLLGSRLTYLGGPVNATGRPRKMSAFYELGSNDLYLVSYFSSPNGLNFSQTLTLTLGVKVDI